MQKYGTVDVTAVRDIVAKVSITEAFAKNVVAFATLEELLEHDILLGYV